ncbi:hypothetical protein J7L02_04160 [Candidatus Woesearchaeota archaeon]|nr:hypothetical protein [Candidatus Woesearchaeota archaeon]
MTIKQSLRIVITTILFLIIAYVIAFKSSDVQSYSIGGNYKNVTIDTVLNITNAAPEVLAVVINGGENITLNAGVNTTVICNVTIRDWNNNYSAGVNDNIRVNATFYYYLNDSNDPDDPNVHYTDTDCPYNSSIDDYTGIYRCEFHVRYFANNGTWYCNATVIDSYNNTGNGWNDTVIYPIWALNITPTIVDYGNVSVSEYSDPPRQVNITNIGNQAINASVTGYGSSFGDGLAMVCTIRNLTIKNEKYSRDPSVTIDQMVNLTSSFQMIYNLTLPKQTQEGTLMFNSTYWRINVPVEENPWGHCTGYLIFSAEQP